MDWMGHVGGRNRTTSTSKGCGLGRQHLAMTPIVAHARSCDEMNVTVGEMRLEGPVRFASREKNKPD